MPLPACYICCRIPGNHRGCPYTRIAQFRYYYYSGNKVELKKRNDKYIIRLKERERDFPKILQSNDITASDYNIEKKYSHVFMISERTGKLFCDLEKIKAIPEIGILSPVYVSSCGHEFGVKNEICIKFIEGISEDIKRKLYDRFGLKVNKSGFYDLLEVPQGGVDVFSIANYLYNTELVEFSHPNFFGCLDFHTDTYYNYQFPLYNAYDDSADVDAPAAWNISMGSSSIVVAVIDDGVEVCSPDIPSSNLMILEGSNFGSSASDDPNDPSPLLGDKHGQCCAGIIVSQHNSYGVRGIAPCCKIMPVRFDYGCSDSDVADAIDFAVTNGADVLSCSWGWNPADVITYAISDAVNDGRDGDGCIVVFSSGNDADHEGYRDEQIIHDAPVAYPGRVYIDYVITVAASDSINHYANYSTFSSYLDVAAPSSHYLDPGQVFTTDRNIGGYNPDSSNVYWPNFGTDNQAYTGRFGGTSAACPLVAGITALMLSVDSSLTAADVFNIITTTADQVGGYTYNPVTGKSQELGHGRVNAYSAVFEASGTKKISVIKQYKINLTEELSIFPNPANPSTTIHYTIAQSGNVSLAVYSVSGQKVATLADGFMPAGTHAAVFDGSSLASGLYLYRFKSKGFAKTGKIVLVK